jgi:type IV secretory pathway TrbL component
MGGAGLREAGGGPPTVSSGFGVNQALLGAVTDGGAVAAGDRGLGLTGRHQAALGVSLNSGVGQAHSDGDGSRGVGQAVSVATAPAQDVWQDTGLLSLPAGAGQAAAPGPGFRVEGHSFSKAFGEWGGQRGP